MATSFLARTASALDRYLVWLALWFVGGLIYFTIADSLRSYFSPAFDPLLFIYWTLVFVVVGSIEGGDWPTLLLYLLGPPFLAWAIYRSIRWISGY